MLKNDIINILNKIEGIVKIVELNDEEKKEIEKLEKEAESKVLMGLCKGINIGVREALNKKLVYACLTNMEFKWPKTSLVKIVCENEVIAEDIYDEELLNKKKEEGNLVLGNLVVYKDKLKIMKERKDKLLAIMLPLPIPELEKINAIVGSPSPPVDKYLKVKFGILEEKPELGTIIIGID
ncbi:MAG: hypothetical protein QXW62_04490 [Candidatus Methanomethylicaceae archaeon]|nr:hypothetical protein [Candidatus Verstraetearchaeota archaeon]